jgi:hypothetical protein
MVREQEIPPSREFNDPILISTKSNVNLIAIVPNAGIPIGIGATNLACPVRRGVVRDNEFEIWKRLSQQRLQRFFQVEFPVAHWHSYADTWNA